MAARCRRGIRMARDRRRACIRSACCREARRHLLPRRPGACVARGRRSRARPPTPHERQRPHGSAAYLFRPIPIRRDRSPLCLRGLAIGPGSRCLPGTRGERCTTPRGGKPIAARPSAAEGDVHRHRRLDSPAVGRHGPRAGGRDRRRQAPQPPPRLSCIVKLNEEVRGTGQVPVAAGDETLDVGQDVVCETGRSRHHRLTTAAAGRQASRPLLSEASARERAVVDDIQHRLLGIRAVEHLRRHLMAPQELLECRADLSRRPGDIHPSASQIASNPERISSANSSI